MGTKRVKVPVLDCGPVVVLNQVCSLSALASYPGPITSSECLNLLLLALAIYRSSPFANISSIGPRTLVQHFLHCSLSSPEF